MNETPNLPECGAWMGAFYVIPCKNAAEHHKQADRLLYAAEGENVEVSYTNALYCGVYPCFISDDADVDTTCFAAAWPDESYELMMQAGGLINRALLAYHRGLIHSLPVTALAMQLKEYIAGAYILQLEESKPFMPILDWEPAKGGAEALAALTPLFPPALPVPPAPLDVPKGYTEYDLERSNPYNQWMYEG